MFCLPFYVDKAGSGCRLLKGIWTDASNSGCAKDGALQVGREENKQGFL